MLYKMAHLFCIIEKREEILQKSDQAFEFVSINCFFCNVCRRCCVARELQKESSRIGIRTFNSDINYRSIDWYKNKNDEHMPKLIYYN